MGVLSQKLLELGFFSVLGTTETGASERSFVARKEPFTFDRNNGVYVVYDEVGRPWIMHFNEVILLNDTFNKICVAWSVRRGAYVPHSNDGGYFIREVLPNL